MTRPAGVLLVLCGLLAACPACAQQAPDPPMRVPTPVPVPMPRPRPPVPEPTDPPARTVVDPRTHLTLSLPAGWNFVRRDGEISTFHLDARSAGKRTQLLAVAGLAFNPYPLSTFSGALLYLSTTPHSSPARCAAEATGPPNQQLDPAVIADQRFTRGHDEHGGSCTEARDVVYTALRAGSCVRFDLAINTFCGDEASGAREMTAEQLRNVMTRLEAVLKTARFASKTEVSGSR